MDRETKSRQSIDKIMSSALEEFGEHGYGRSSINAICSKGGISKGVVYHHFKDKDELYIACVSACFTRFAAHLRGSAVPVGADIQQQLQSYFDARLAFFEENPLYQRLFCSAVISPPSHLSAAIMEAKADFDACSIASLTRMLKQVRLRADTTIDDVVDVFRTYQDFVNAQAQMEPLHDAALKKQEHMRRRSLQTLLYGVIERKDG